MTVLIVAGRRRSPRRVAMQAAPSACALNVIIARARPRAGAIAPARPWFGPQRAAILVERRAVGRPRRRSPRAKSRRAIREADEKLPVITGRSA